MKSKIGLLLVTLAILLLASAPAFAASFFIDTNQLGYSYTAWNITQSGTPYGFPNQNGAWLYSVHGLGAAYDGSMFIAVPNDFQLYDLTNASTASASGSWDPTFTIFSASVSGGSLKSAPLLWLWQIFYEADPVDYFAGIDYVDYNYQLTAIFADPAVYDSGFMVNSGNPISLTGTFWGTFKASYDTSDNPISNPDTYGFSVTFFNQAVDLDTLQGVFGDDAVITNQFGAEAAPVPEPSMIILLVIGLGAVCLVSKRRT